MHPNPILPCSECRDNAARLYGALNESSWREHAKLVLMTPEGLASPEFARDVTQPLSELQVETWAEFSSRLPSKNVGVWVGGWVGLEKVERGSTVDIPKGGSRGARCSAAAATVPLSCSHPFERPASLLPLLLPTVPRRRLRTR